MDFLKDMETINTGRLDLLFGYFRDGMCNHLDTPVGFESLTKVLENVLPKQSSKYWIFMFFLSSGIVDAYKHRKCAPN